MWLSQFFFPERYKNLVMKEYSANKLTLTPSQGGIMGQNVIKKKKKIRKKFCIAHLFFCQVRQKYTPLNFYDK